MAKLTPQSTKPHPAEALKALIHDLGTVKSQLEIICSQGLGVLGQITLLLDEAAELQLEHRSGLPANITALCTEFKQLCISPGITITADDAGQFEVPDRVDRMMDILRDLTDLLPALRVLIDETGKEQTATGRQKSPAVHRHTPRR